MFFSHYCAKIKVNSFHYLPTEKTVTLHNIIKFCKSVLNKDENHHYYYMFSEKNSYQLKNNFLMVY